MTLADRIPLENNDHIGRLAPVTASEWPNADTEMSSGWQEYVASKDVLCNLPQGMDKRDVLDINNEYELSHFIADSTFTPLEHLVKGTKASIEASATIPATVSPAFATALCRMTRFRRCHERQQAPPPSFAFRLARIAEHVSRDHRTHNIMEDIGISANEASALGGLINWRSRAQRILDTYTKELSKARPNVEMTSYEPGNPAGTPQCIAKLKSPVHLTLPLVRSVLEHFPMHCQSHILSEAFLQDHKIHVLDALWIKPNILDSKG